MNASRQARAGLPISAKLILATSIVVAAAVAITAWFNSRTIDELNDMHVDARRQTGEDAITNDSERFVQSVAATVAIPLGGHTYNDVNLLVENALAQDKKRADARRAAARKAAGEVAVPDDNHRIRWVVVSDDVGAVVFRTPAAPPAEKLAEQERLLADGIATGDVVHARTGKTDWIYGAPIKLVDVDTKVDRTVGALRIGVSTADLENELNASLAKAKTRVDAAQMKAWLVSALVLAIGIVLAALQGVQLARPIRALTVQASRIASGDLSSRVPEGRRDELGVLARTFNLMANEISDLLVHRVQKASLEKEMELARQVQQAMLPPDKLDQHGAFKIVGYCQPASSCGGDWWTYHKLSNGRMLFVLGDATGHGIHSAMIAATARGAVEALSGIDERLLTPEQVLRAIDSAIRQVGDHNVLMTAFAAVFDSTNGILHYANAGQNFPYVIKLGATKLLEEASIIAASGNPLGDRNIAVEIRRGSLQMRPGDLFVCFTDGVVERANPAGKLFGDRRLRGALTGQPLRDAASLVQLRDLLVTTLDRYGDGALAEDDITFVLCQFDPPAEAGSGRPSQIQQGAA
ncbi:MAG: SpoIIE family protein phosphatase [Deltaproteobacteria bacterium]|nr:SpoIIE family protein phosphatase [Deltaproteobacteria bacterium]